MHPTARIITALLVIFSLHNQIQASRVFIKTPYEIEDGQFMLFEIYDKYIVLNEYPTIHSTNPLEKNSPVLNEKNVTIGRIIGSDEDFYPITYYRNNVDLYCGRYNLRELAGYNKSVSYRFYWWENIDDFYSDMEETMKRFNGKFCYIYASD